MDPDTPSELDRGHARAQVGPWLRLLSLWVLFEAPQLVQAGGFSASRLVLSSDPAILLLLYLLTWSRAAALGPWVRVGRGALGALTVLLFLYSVDGALWRSLMRSEPLLYDQLVMARHTLVLVGDLWSWKIAGALALAVAAFALLSWWVAKSLPMARQIFFDGEGRRRMKAVAAAAFVVFSLSLIPGTREKTRTLAVDLARNVAQSLSLARALQQEIAASAYQDYLQIKLERKPRIELFFIESYGRMLHDDAGLRGAWHSRLRLLDEHLQAGGLSVVSGFSEAPVSGGRSWIAEGAVLMGTPVKYEVAFRNLIDNIERLPHLVSFLDRNGYETVLLAPADRVRLGLENENRYSYDRTVTFDDLAYPGPPIGWGRIPDEYSLFRTKRTVLDEVDGPLFFNFHMVSSHAPWKEVPEWKGEAELLREGERTRENEDNPGESAAELEKRLRRLRRDEDHVFAFHGELDEMGRQAYARAIFYELRVIGEYLREPVPDRFVILMGDHQPPVIAPHNAGFQVPIHVLATDRELLGEFERLGFKNGVIPQESSQVRHEALFSLIVRTLAGCCSQSPAPPVQPRGVQLGR